MRPLSDALVWTSSTNCEKVVCMSEATRISAATLAKRLGPPPADSGQPTYRILADRIRSAVLDGRLAVATGLPSERDLATGLSLSRTTVGAAYALLRDQGWLDSRRGSGSTLRLPSGDGRRPAAPGSPAREAPGASFGAGGIFGWQDGIGWRHDAVDGADPEQAMGVVDLTTACLPAPEEPLTAAVAAAVAELPRYLRADGYRPFGLPVLRAAIAARYSATGLPTTAEQILVTSGAQHAFTLVMGELSAPGDRVLIECPTYPVALDALRAQRRVPAPVGLADPSADTDSGSAWDTDLFTATLRQTAPRLGYLIPDFHNPTGALMDVDTRERLVAAARAARTLLLVDESFRDVPFPGTPPIPPPVAVFDTDSGGTRVLSLGSVSKSFWGGLRVGWIRAAATLVHRLAAARAMGDMAGPILDQLVVAQLLADPEPALSVQRSRLATGAAALQAALARDLPDWEPTHPQGGTSLWVRLPGPRFGPDGTMASYLRLPFTTTPERLTAGIARLATVAGQAAVGARSSLPGWLT